MKKSEVVNYYKSTPQKKNWAEHSGSPGSIRKNEIPKNYATSETNETSNMFRMRMVPKVNLSASANKIQSNVFNIALSEPGTNDDIR